MIAPSTNVTPPASGERAVGRDERLGDEERCREQAGAAARRPRLEAPGGRTGRGSARSHRPCRAGSGPGFQSSTTMPRSPIESMSAMRFGSTRRSRARCQNVISTSVISAPAVFRTSPFGTVSTPSIFRSRAGSVGAIDLDDPELERLARAEVRRFRDHLAGGFHVPVVLARELADVRGRVVDDLPAQVVRDVLAARARSGSTSRCSSAAPSRRDRRPS